MSTHVKLNCIVSIKASSGANLYHCTFQSTAKMRCALLLMLLVAPMLLGGQTRAQGATNATANSSAGGCVGFLHGVASGDPRPASVIIWTRITPDSNSSAGVQVAWHMSTSPNTSNSTQGLQQGEVTASLESDFTVKVTVTNLQPATRYYYWFTAGNYSSLLGTTKTAPAEGANATLRFAQMSCASWRWGYFNVYDMTSRVRDLDFIVFLGDWIYEYGNDQYPAAGKGVEGRAPLEPPHELATLDDYRTRHRLFHTDAYLVEMMRRAPIIAIWDDHDVAADNAYKNGTANPVDAVTYANRRCNGVQAYMEYMPITTPTSNSSSGNSSSSAGNSTNNSSAVCGGLADIYRTFTFGNTMTLVMIEQRVTARDEQFNHSTSAYIKALQQNEPEQWATLPDLQQKRQDYYAALEATNRSMIGAQQVSQLRADMSASAQAGITWQVLGNTVVMGPMNSPDIESAAQQQGPVAQTILQGLLELSTSELLELGPGLAASARELVGTGRYHDPVITDGWSGYQNERNQVLNILAQSTTNPVVLSGDIHNAFVWRLFRDNSSAPVAIEFTTASVTSPGVDMIGEKAPSLPLPVPGDPVQLLLDLAETGLQISNNPSMLYANIRKRGAIYHTVSPSLWHADYSFVETKDQPQSPASCQAAFEMSPGTAGQIRNASCTTREQLFLDLYGPGDPLNIPRGQANLTTAPVPGTQLSSSPSQCGAAAAQPPAGRSTSPATDPSSGVLGVNLNNVPVVNQFVSRASRNALPGVCALLVIFALTVLLT